MLYLVMLFATQNLICLSQGIKIVKVEETNSGADAFHAPNDKNGIPCGLVKLKSTFSDLSFYGQIVGNVDNKTNEYYIFMERGATKLTVSRPNVLPVIIFFPDYGIESIVSKATYSVQIKDIKLNTKTNMVSVDVKPRFAKIFIDDMQISQEVSDNGHYQILLPKGSHVCRFEADGYAPYVRGINVGKENPNLSIELESQLSDLDVSCQTSLASIYINDSLVGKGAWKGKLSSGDYKIDVKKNGYVPYSQSLTLKKKETRSIVVPELNRKKGKLIVETHPIDFCNAFIDGFKIDKFPIEIEVGEHLLFLQAYGCDTVINIINVVDEEINHFIFTLSAKNKFYESAYKGDLEIMMALADNKMDGKNENDLQELRFWLSMIISKMESINTLFLSKPFLDDYNKIMEFRNSIGYIDHYDRKNYEELFYLFSSGHVKDYENALAIIDRCAGMEKEFDGVFCKIIGEVCMKANRDKEAISWFMKCIESDTYDHVKEQARQSINKIEQVSK